MAKIVFIVVSPCSAVAVAIAFAAVFSKSLYLIKIPPGSARTETVLSMLVWPSPACRAALARPSLLRPGRAHYSKLATIASSLSESSHLWAAALSAAALSAAFWLDSRRPPPKMAFPLSRWASSFETRAHSPRRTLKSMPQCAHRCRIAAVTMLYRHISSHHSGCMEMRGFFLLVRNHVSILDCACASLIRFLAMLKYPSSSSMPIKFLPVLTQATPVEPLPIVKSSTVPPGLLNV